MRDYGERGQGFSLLNGFGIDERNCGSYLDGFINPQLRLHDLTQIGSLLALISKASIPLSLGLLGFEVFR